MTKTEILQEAYRSMLLCYGEKPPVPVMERFEKERFLLSEECLQMLYMLGTLGEELALRHSPLLIHGQYMASFIGHLLGASDVNPLPPHYYCRQCHKWELVKDARSGFDLPAKTCSCGAEMVADGHNIPVESLAQQVSHYYSVECSVAGECMDSVTDILHDALAEYGDVVPLRVKGDEDSAVYVLFAKDAPAPDADGFLHVTAQEYAEKYDDLPHVRVNHSELADRLRAAWNKAGGVPLPRQFCEAENLFHWQLGRDVLNESLAETMLGQTLQFSTLVQEMGFFYGTHNWIGNGEKLVEQGVEFMDIPAHREDVFQRITARHPTAQGFAVRVMDEARKGRFSYKGMPVEVENTLREMRMKPWFIDYCKTVDYLFPKAHSVDHLCWELTMQWYERYGFAPMEK